MTPHRHHRGMASAIDDCPVRVLVSLKRDWRSPLKDDTPVVISTAGSPSTEGERQWTPGFELARDPTDD